MKDKIIEILKEYFVEGYEYPPDSGRKEHRISMAVIDADDADIIASRIEGLGGDVERINKYGRHQYNRGTMGTGLVPYDEWKYEPPKEKASADEWVSIDQKPKLSKLYGRSVEILAWDGGDRYLAFYDFTLDRWRESYSENELIGITKWRELPEPPKN